MSARDGTRNAEPGGSHCVRLLACMPSGPDVGAGRTRGQWPSLEEALRHESGRSELITRWRRKAVCAGTLLAVGWMGSGCLEKEETAGGTLADRREAQLQAQSFESYGDGRLPQEIKAVPTQGTGGSGGAGPAAPTAAPQGKAEPAPSAPATAPGQKAAPAEQDRPRQDSGSSPEKG